MATGRQKSPPLPLPQLLVLFSMLPVGGHGALTPLPLGDSTACAQDAEAARLAGALERVNAGRQFKLPAHKLDTDDDSDDEPAAES